MDSILSFLQHFYRVLGVETAVNAGDFYGLLTVLFLVGAATYQLVKSSKSKVSSEIPEKPIETKVSKEVKATSEEKTTKESATTAAPTSTPTLTPEPESEIQATEEERSAPQPEPQVQGEPSLSQEEKGKRWFARLHKGLKSSRENFWGKFEKVFSGKSNMSEALEDIEELLYSSDLGPKIVGELLQKLETKMAQDKLNPHEMKMFLYDFFTENMEEVQKRVPSELYYLNDSDDTKDDDNSDKLKVIMIVGVNGVGKTTTVGKLATRLKNEGAKVVVGACDTFRAAAVEQLQVWCERAGVSLVKLKEGSGPSGVAFEAVKEALNEKADYLLLDTAGRLHNKANLMEELHKIKKVVKKAGGKDPWQTLLVLDAITGQNALNQAREFHQILDLTGLIFTKCDGSSKAGNAIPIVKELNVPITYIGVGESIEDLNIFKLEEFLSALLDLEVPEQSINLKTQKEDLSKSSMHIS